MPTLRGTPTTTVASVASTRMVIVTPAGIVANDVLVVGWAMDTIATVTTATGWTLQKRQTDSAQGNDQTLECYTRLATGSEATSYVWTTGAAVSHCGFFADIQSVAATSTPNVVSSGAGLGSTVVAPTISTNAANCLLMGIFTVDHSAPGTKSYSSGNMTTEVVDITASSWASIAMYTDQFAGPGLTGTRSASTDSGGATSGWMAILLAFAPGATTSAQVVEFYSDMTLMGVM